MVAAMLAGGRAAALVCTGLVAACSATGFDWQANLERLAARPNVFLKIGGMNARLHGCDFMDRALPPTSEELARAWQPHVHACLEIFGARRCMFESNFPPDKCGVSARVLWNAFKRLAAGGSASEKADLFAGTAIRVYRLPPELAGSPATCHGPR